jgi:hypothetical protein
VGFVNFCYSAATRRSVQNSIKGWIRETREVTNHSDEPGDILTVGDHHIGLATGDGHALQAAQASRGVILTPLRHSGWDRRGRYFH